MTIADVKETINVKTALKPSEVNNVKTVMLINIFYKMNLILIPHAIV